MNAVSTTTPAGAPRDTWFAPWLWELQLAALVAFVGGAFFLRLGAIPLIGEETRRALIAREMVQSGDWIVPHQQGLPRLTKPPIQFWAIALSTELFAAESIFALRFPSAVSVLLMAVLTYGYCRLFLTPNGALAGSLAWLTSLEVIHSGRFAQTDGLFLFFLSGSLLLWHWGYLRRWPAWRAWAIGYGFAALATLTKGPQGPVYFVGGVGIHLLLRRDWRYLCSIGHLVGLLTFSVVLGCWLVPFWQQLGNDAVYALFLGESLARANPFVQPILGHLVRFPFEVFLCALPASGVLFLVCFTRAIREQMRSFRDPVSFLLGVCLFAFPTCWLPPGGEPRYLLPLYPCLGCLVGIVLEALSRCNPTDATIRRLAVGLRVTTLMLILGGTAFALVMTVGKSTSVGLALVFASGGLVASLLAWRSSGPKDIFLGFAALAGFVAFCYSTILINHQQHMRRDMEREVASQLHLIPVGEPLVSLHWVHHRFSYYYPEPIRAFSGNSETPAEGAYFCWDPILLKEPLPYAYEHIGAVQCSRHTRSPSPAECVILARRLPKEASPQPPRRTVAHSPPK